MMQAYKFITNTYIHIYLEIKVKFKDFINTIIVLI